MNELIPKFFSGPLCSPVVKNYLSRIGICLIIIAALACSGLPSPLYIIYQNQLSLSNIMVNILFSAYAVGVLITLMIIIKIGDKVRDRRQLIILSAILLIVSSLTMIYAGNIWQLIVGRLLSGVATGSLLGSATAALLELHKRNDPKASALLSTIAFTMGSGLGPSISGFFINIDLNPTITSYIPLIIIALISIPLVMLARMPVISTQVNKRGGCSNKLNPLKSLPFYVAAFSLVSSWSIGAVFMSSGQLFTTKLALVSNAFVAAALISGFQFSAGFGQLLSGKFNQLTAVISGISICTAAQMLMCVFALKSLTVPYEISSLFTGFGYGLSFVGATGIVNTYAPKSQRASYISAYYVSGYVFGNAVPAVVVGALIDYFSLPTAMVAFTGWIIFVWVILWYVCHTMSHMIKTSPPKNAEITP